MNHDQRMTVNVRSGRGRPPKLTAAMIVAKARELLVEMQPDEINFARISQELRVPSSSIYNYFPNREGLLAAVAVDVFGDFQFDDPGSRVPWQQRLRLWLDEIERFFDRNPVAFRVMATKSQPSLAWINARGPLLQVLRGLGLEGRELTLVHSWFEGQLTGMLLIEYHAGRNRLLVESEAVPISPATEAERCELERRPHLSSIRREEIVDMGFKALIAALERMAGGKAGS